MKTAFSRTRIAIVLAMLWIATLTASSATTLDFSLLSKVFDVPFGSEPVLRHSRLNGLRETRVTWKTRVPFEMLRAYYVKLLENTPWRFMDIDELIRGSLFEALSESGFPGRQFFFLNGEHMLTAQYWNEDAEGYFSLSLQENVLRIRRTAEGVPGLFEPGFRFPGAEAVLCYETGIPGQGDAVLVSFETHETPEIVSEYYQRELELRGWEPSPLLREFQEKFLQYAGERRHEISQAFGRARVFQNRENGSTLFFFASKHPEKPGTLFGYFVKK